VIYDRAAGLGGSELIASGYGTMRARPTMTNNVAEYAAAGAAIKAALDTVRCPDLLVCGDSMLVIRQMTGEWGVKGGAYVPVRERLVALVNRCSFSLSWRWIPREENAEADALSMRALSEIGINRRRR
jgi:ribonuclease HI